MLDESLMFSRSCSYLPKCFSDYRLSGNEKKRKREREEREEEGEEEEEEE